MGRSRNQTGLIPNRLLSDVKKGDRVLFLGADLPLGYPHAPPSRPELAAALAEKYDLPRGKSWPQTATDYLSTFHEDRHGLVTFVREHSYGPRVAPGPIHRAIAQAGFRAIVTAWYDELLERTLRDAGYTVNRVVRDVQLPYAREGEREVIVVKLYGCLSDPESLVLDMWDHEELTQHLSRKLELATAFCSIRPPLFVGFNLLDRMPINLYVRASRNMAEHMRRAYAIWPHDLEPVEGAWYGKNVEFRRADATAFLEALAVQLPPVRAIEEKAKRVDRPPYKFLDYYEADDADIFCGRDTESQIVTRLALSHRLLTLFGPSGAGKTSLLLAGVVPQLAAWEYQHTYVRALDDPLTALRRAIAARAGLSEAPSPRLGGGSSDLRTFLNAAIVPEDRLVVILDQFEELFIRVGSRARAAFFEQLAAALDEPERDVRVLISLREDYLAYLDEARDYLPDIFSNSFRLTSLDRANARVAITEPAARAGVTVEPALVDALVGSEGRAEGSGALVEIDDHVTRVFPAALQIVLDRLYRQALPEDHDPQAPPPEGLTLTFDAYRAIEHARQREGEAPEVLHGAEAILAGYVGDAVARLSELTHEDGTLLGADPDLGREALKVLVTGQATKAVLTRTEIEDLLEEVGALRCDDRRDMALLDATLLGLQRVRLLRSFEREGAGYYELTHDTLAKEISTWIDKAEMQARLARELLRREVENWQRHGLLISPDALQFIHEQRDRLRRVSNEELELLLRSALQVGHGEVSYWLSRVSDPKWKVRVLIDATYSESSEVRQWATDTLGEWVATDSEMATLQVAEALSGLLEDEVWDVQSRAIKALRQVWEANPDVVPRASRRLIGLRRSAPIQPEVEPTRLKEPYKFLSYYGTEDESRFFGRSQEAQRLSLMIHANRLVLLYGPPGVGKTSLLMAGVVPRLEPYYKTLYIRVLADPVKTIHHAVRRSLPESDLPGDSSLLEFLDAATMVLERPMVIIFDQFEELFTRLSPQARAAFIEELGALYEARNVPVRMLFSIREDWFAEMGEVKVGIPEIFHTSMRLLPLSRDQARQAIIGPAERLGFTFEAALIERILDDLASESARGVMPSQLQIVCNALYKSLAPDEHLFTLALYEQLGGARVALHDFLDNILAQLSSNEQALARCVLKDLVTSEATKATKTSDELASALEMDLSEIEPLLEKLLRERVLNSLETEDEERAYELAHEYIASRVISWVDEEEMQAKQVRELLDRELQNWYTFGLLIAPDRFRLIHEERKVLRRLDADALELLFRSALNAGYEVDLDYWFKRAREAGVDVDAIAREGLKN